MAKKWGIGVVWDIEEKKRRTGFSPMRR